MVAGRRLLLVLLPGLVAACDSGSDGPTDPLEIHHDLFVMDMHVDSVLFTTLYGTDFSEPHPPPQGPAYLFRPQADLPGLIEGGIDAIWFGIVVFPLCDPDACFADALNTIRTAKRVIAENSDRMELALTPDDVDRIRAEGRIPTLMGLEGAHGVGERVENVDTLHAEGVRYVGLAHFTPNRYAMTNVLSGVPGGGLSDDGKALIRRMNELGMIVDLAHTHPASIRDALAESVAPAIVSHTGVRGAFDIFRNLGDEEMIAIAEDGGAVGVFFASLWIAEGNTSTVADVVDHIDHVVRTVGIDHVGIGSDFDGFVKLPDDLAEADELPALTVALLERGYAPGDLRKLYAENMMRVFREVTEVAADLREGARVAPPAPTPGVDPTLARHPDL